MLLALSDNQEQFLRVLLKDAYEGCCVFEKLEEYENCSVQGDEWVFLESEIHYIKKILLMLDDKERESFLDQYRGMEKMNE